MRRRLLRWLVCPICQGQLRLLEAEVREQQISASDRATLEGTVAIDKVDEVEKEIITGALSCDHCRLFYPICNAVPRMLSYSTRLAEVFIEKQRAWLEKNLEGYSLGSSPVPPGEEDVLRNFSAEWKDYEWTGKSYWSTTPANMLRVKRYELGLSKHALKHKLACEVGIGIGGTADLLSRHESCEVVGVDLGYSVDQASRYFGNNPLFHIVQASIFGLPFRPGTFDLVYSHGVLHHTYSPLTAFNRVAQLPKFECGMLYVWLYSHDQESATILRRILMGIEGVVRPTLSRLPQSLQTACLIPTLPLYMLRQNVYEKHKYGKANAAHYGWNEALHAARDRLTPPFAYRHSYEEVVGWFRSANYGGLELLRDEKPPEAVPESYRINVGVRGFRASTRGEI